MISRVDYKDVIVDIDTICYNTMVFCPDSNPASMRCTISSGRILFIQAKSPRWQGLLPKTEQGRQGRVVI